MAVLMTRPLMVILALYFMAWSPPAVADGAGTYMSPDAFLAGAFEGKVPEPSLLWMTRDIKPEVSKILGHPYGMLRVRYWREGNRSAWILEEIGKEEPITSGFVIDDGRLSEVKVLIFRESRGWEVRYPFFTDQFRQAGLGAENALDADIDGISGATLSVSAVTRLARLALYFDKLTGPEE